MTNEGPPSNSVPTPCHRRYRYIIQKDADIPLTPRPRDVVVFELVTRNAVVVYDACDFDVQYTVQDCGKVTVKNAYARELHTLFPINWYPMATWSQQTRGREQEKKRGYITICIQIR